MSSSVTRAEQEPIEAMLVKACLAFRNTVAPEAAVVAAERCVLDWLGCVLVGAQLPPAAAIAQAHRTELGSGIALSFTGPALAAPGVAALINGTAAHTAELDDIYSPALYHPGAPVIAAALAAAQIAQADGRVFLQAVIAGYEISNRIGAAINPSHYEFWHTTGTIGTLGAAVAAAHAMGLDAEQTGWAIGHAASMAAGLQQAFRSDGMTKPLHSGRAAEAGLLAARLAQQGLVGAQSMLSGDVGLGQAMSRGARWDEVGAGLFVDFTIEQMTFKRFSACGHTFAPIDAVLELMKQEKIDPTTVESIQVCTYQKAADVAGIAIPKSAFEARFSIPFGVAAALIGHDLSRSDTYDEHYANGDIRDLIKRISVRVDPDMSKAFPGLRGAQLAIHSLDGTRRNMTVPTRKGEPGNPLTDGELEQKFCRLAEDAGFGAAARELRVWVYQLKQGIGIDCAQIPGMRIDELAEN